MTEWSLTAATPTPRRASIALDRKAKRPVLHSQVQHLAWALWLNHSPQRSWLTMLAAYFDASGDQYGGQPLVVAGLASTEGKWLHFERQWRSMLREFRVPYLHMREYAHSVGPYRLWKDDPATRRHFLARATDVIGRHVKHVSTLYVDPKDFREVDEQYELGEFYSGAYPIAAGGCAIKVKEWKGRRYKEQPIHYVFEAGDAGQDRLARLLPHYGMDVTIRRKQDQETGTYFTPFQAADFVAYEVARRWAGHGGRPRQSLVGLTERVNLVVNYFPRESLVALVEAYPELFPRRR